MPVQAQTTSEFGYQLHPEKLLENTEATLQIFVTSNEMMVPIQIKDLKTVSSDNAIIQILSIEDGNDKFTKNVLIKARKAGMATIALAAPGFSSKEISFEVFNNNNYPSQILMKVTPEVFPTDGYVYGHITLELATTGGLPALALEDTTIQLYTPNNDIIKLKNSEITITSGKYYAITEFEKMGHGDAIIFAETEDMERISSIVNVLESNGPLQLQLNIFPENYNSFSVSAGFAIIYLLDNSGTPVIAEEDIHFKLGIEESDVSINTSKKFEEINFDKKQLVIEKGSYSAFTKFTPRPNLGDYTEENQEVYNMFISAEDVLTVGDSFTVHHDQIGSLEGEGPSITKVLPFLTTGKEEIIAVTYYETDVVVSRETEGLRILPGEIRPTSNRELVTVTVPVQARDDHKISFSSSELDAVNPIDPIMKKGQNAVIVYGKTSTVGPEDSVVFYITDNEGIKTVSGIPIGPSASDLALIVEPLVPMILAEEEFPVLVYLEDGVASESNPTGGMSPFIKDVVLTFSANDLIETDSLTIKQDQPYALINMMSNEVGETELSYQMSGFEGTTKIVSHTTDPAEIYLAFPKNILANSKTLATVQLLDSARDPVYAKKDIKITLVSNDEQILKTAQELTIKNGNYFTTFELEGINEGEIELALLSEDFSLTRYDINVVDITPVPSLDILGGLNWNERIEAKLSITIPEITVALDGFIVEWETDGGEVKSKEEITNREGIAVLNIIANDKDKVTITATVSGNGLSSATVSKTVDILNMPVEIVLEETVTEPSIGLPLDNVTMMLIIIPVAIGGALFFLKRTDRLDMITEKIPIGDKLDIGDRIEGIKERISDIRNR